MKSKISSGKYTYALLFLLIVLGIYAIMKETDTDTAIESFAPKADRILILDAGHGGDDGGASSASGLRESEVNLDIVLRMREICRLLAVPVLLTRDSEELPYPANTVSLSSRKLWDTRKRVDMINEQPNAMLLSVHQNCYPGQEPRGPQIFYSENPDSVEKAHQIQFYMTKNLYPANRRVAAPMPDGLYIPEHIQCPAILCECGFLSNPEEAKALATEEYRIKIAVILMAAYLNPTEETI